MTLQREGTREFFKSLVLNMRREMSPEVRARKKTLRVPAKWRYPHRIEREYYRYIRDLMLEFRGPTINVIGENLKRWLVETDFSDGDIFDAYDEEFDALIGNLRQRQNTLFVDNEAEIKGNVFQVGAEVNTFNAKQWERVTSVAVGTPFSIDSGWVPGLLRNWTDMNYTLIRSLSDEYIKKVNTIVAEGVQQGSLYTTIMKDLRKMDKNMTRDRSELIARDQVGKLNGSLTEGRLLDAGVPEYIWSTALDERVRAAHRQMNGSRNKWGDRTVYIPRGGSKYIKRSGSMQGAIPGSQVQCRCTALAAFDDIVKDVDELIEKEEAERPELAFGGPISETRSQKRRRRKGRIKPPRID
ncbi:MAG: minor capsid protein [Deltaproteobacteria bacterium]|nr:minor capsid protein [Deltaproteobacteria bacterium]